MKIACKVLSMMQVIFYNAQSRLAQRRTSGTWSIAAADVPLPGFEVEFLVPPVVELVMEG